MSTQGSTGRGAAQRINRTGQRPHPRRGVPAPDVVIGSKLRVRRPETPLTDDHHDMQTVLDFAIHHGYLLIGRRDRVYIRNGEDDEVHAVHPAEERIVHQLLRDRSFTIGERAPYTCGNQSGRGDTVVVPRRTRKRCHVANVPDLITGEIPNLDT